MTSDPMKLFFLALLVGVSASASYAQSGPGDASAGRSIVEKDCVSCHAIGGPSKPDQKAPSLAAVAAMPSTTSLSLHAFLMTSHPRMPNYILSEREVDDVVAYILSLRSY